MKRYFCKIAYLWALLPPLLIGCNDFLEIEVIGKNNTNAFFADIDGLRAALPGAYRTAYNFYDNEFLKYGDVAGNMLRMSSVSGSFSMLDQYNFTSAPELSQETLAVGYLWKRGFVVMTNVNNILEYAPGLKESYPYNIQEIDNICAQAYFLRALMLLNLSLCYAQPYSYTPDASHWGAPILTRPPAANETILRSTMKQTYQQVIDDLESSLQSFSDAYTATPYYASPIACKALLARVYLYMGNWKLAEQYAGEAISAVPLTPRENYVDMFAQNETGKEAIFRLSAYDAGKQLSAFYKYGSATAYPADTLYSLFTDDRDIRLSVLYNNPTTKRGKNCMKYSLRNANDQKEGVSIFVLRASEMYFIRAEARMEQGLLQEAVSDLKIIAGRALGIAPDEVELTYLDKKDVDRLIEIERIKELCFEGHRFFDIARQKKDVVREANTNSAVRLLTYPDYRYALPIPLVEVDANPQIQQNEGYY